MKQVLPQILLIVFTVIYVGALFAYKVHHDNKVFATIDALEQDAWGRKYQEFQSSRQVLQSEISQLLVEARDPYKGRTLTTENKLVLQEYTPNDKHAIVTMIGAESYMHAYWMGAVAVIQGLREVKTRVPNIVVMVRKIENIPETASVAFERLGAQLISIEGLDLSKLNVDIPGTWGNLHFFTIHRKTKQQKYKYK